MHVLIQCADWAVTVSLLIFLRENFPFNPYPTMYLHFIVFVYLCMNVACKQITTFTEWHGGKINCKSKTPDYNHVYDTKYVYKYISVYGCMYIQVRVYICLYMYVDMCVYAYIFHIIIECASTPNIYIYEQVNGDYKR